MNFKTNQPILIAGATGHIGSCFCFSSLIARLSSHLILYSRNEDKLIGLREELYETGLYPLRVDIITSLDQLKQLPKPRYVLYSISSFFRKESTREEMLHKNADLAVEFAEGFKPFVSNLKLMICVTNPVDAIGMLLYHHLGLSPEKICSLSALDTIRYRKYLGRKLNLGYDKLEDVYTLGSHDNQMAVMQSLSYINGKSISDFISEGVMTQNEFDEVVQQVILGGSFIIKHRGYTAFESPAYLILNMFIATLPGEQPFLLPSSRWSVDPLFPGVFIALKTVINESGVHQIQTTPKGEDRKRLDKSYKWLLTQKEQLIVKGYLPKEFI